jgi:iron complex outermembrane receptor protein
MTIARQRPQLAFSLLASTLLCLPNATFAQRAAENAVSESDDAFGTSIGSEEIGLYSSVDVRGFSPTAAGNVRIEGLYFDQVWGLTSRVRRSTRVRVGLTALGHPFPAPTGVIDYSLRTPGKERLGAVAAYVDTDGGGGLEIDAELPIFAERLSIGAGLGLYKNVFQNGTDSLQHIESLTLRWAPSDRLELVPFWARSDIYDDEIGPIYVPAGVFLPPRIERRQFNGPSWATYEGTAQNHGILARAQVASDWVLRAGVFRSAFENEQGFTQLLTNLTTAGSANRLIVADAPDGTRSTSGEIRLIGAASEGPRLHKLHLSIRGRDRASRYDGVAEIDLGPTTLTERIDVPRPALQFSPQTTDDVNQWTFGVAYEGRWKRVGEISAGIQKTDYRKTVLQPALPIASNAAAPRLYSIAVAAHLSEAVALYAGSTRGLEESGVAPLNAVNRNEALPTIETRQTDLGVRWTFPTGVKLVAGLFEIRKPYFNLDASNRYQQLGSPERWPPTSISAAG